MGGKKTTDLTKKRNFYVQSLFRLPRKTNTESTVPNHRARFFFPADCASLKAAAAWLKVTRKILLHNLKTLQPKITLILCQKSSEMEKLMEIWNFHSLNFNN